VSRSWFENLDDATDRPARCDNNNEEERDGDVRAIATFEQACPVARATPDSSETQAKGIELSVTERHAILRFGRDNVAEVVNRQKERADRSRDMEEHAIGDHVLLSAQNTALPAASSLGTTKLLPRFIGPFRIVDRLGNACTVGRHTIVPTHPFCVERLKRYAPVVVGEIRRSSRARRRFSRSRTGHRAREVT